MFVSSSTLPLAGVFGELSAADRFCTQLVENNAVTSMKTLLAMGIVGYRAFLPDANNNILDRFTNDLHRPIVTPDNVVRYYFS